MMMLFALLFSLLLSWMQNDDFLSRHQRWVIQPKSTISVSGTSNIKDFTCRIEGHMPNDTLAFHLAPEAQIIVFRQQTLHIPLEPFDCGNRIIRNDFLKTLKSEVYPYFKLQLHDLRLSDSKYWWQDTLTGAINITMAGKSMRYKMNYQLHIYSRHLIELAGEQTFQFSDFNLIPPQRLAGLVKIDNTIQVSFRFILRDVKAAKNATLNIGP